MKKGIAKNKNQEQNGDFKMKIEKNSERIK